MRIHGVLRFLEGGDLEGARGALLDLLAASPAAVNLLHPRRILIAGRPNSGKSCLFNRLAERERAAVTPVAGTTRDLLEETVALAGFPVVFIDSSGLRGNATDPVEREGIRRARTADFDSLLFLMERSGPPESDEAEFMTALPSRQVLLVRTKADLHPEERTSPVEGEAGWISAKAGTGLDRLRERIVQEWLGPPEGEYLPPAPFTGGQVEMVRKAASASSVDGMRLVLVQWLPNLHEMGPPSDAGT
jgi:tRNA modification GTPase